MYKRQGLTCVSLLILIGLWVLVSNSRPDFFPTPQATWERFMKMIERPISKTTVAGHVLISLKRVLIALVIAVISGVGICLLYTSPLGTERGLYGNFYKKRRRRLRFLFSGFLHFRMFAEFQKILHIGGQILAFVINQI